MKVLFAVPTYKRFSDCWDLVQQVFTISRARSYQMDVLVIDNSAGGFTTYKNTKTEEQQRQFFVTEENTQHFKVWTNNQNIGVARSFNAALYYANTLMYDYLIISNDDLTLNENTLDLMIAHANNTPDQLLFCTEGATLNAFSLFLVRPKQTLLTIGYFETAYFSYLEDNDFAYRLRLIGFDLCRVPGCEISSHVVSGTIQHFNAEEAEKFHQYRANGTHEYLRKWGGGPHEERYTTPYNSGIDSYIWHNVMFSKFHPFIL